MEEQYIWGLVEAGVLSIDKVIPVVTLRIEDLDLLWQYVVYKEARHIATILAEK